MIDFNKQQQKLTLSSFPDEMGLDHLRDSFNEFKQQLSPEISEVICDLKGIQANNYSVITFLISCGEQCAKSGKSINLENIEGDKFQATLHKLGFKEKDLYQPKEFRETKAQPIAVVVGEASYKFFNDTKKLIGFIGETTKAVFYLFKNPRKLDLREVLFYMDKSGADAVPIVMLICFLIGLILAFQGIMQMEKFGLEIYVADLVSLAVVRELGPLMVGMICIGRAGSAYAAELGTMKVSEELDAMQTMGLKPERFLVIPKIIALLIVMPMLVVIGDICGVIGGVMIGTTMSDITFIEYWHRTLEALIPANVVETLLKATIFSFIIAAVGCFRGMEADNDAKGVGNATTSAVVTGIFLVIVADFLVTFIFPRIVGLFGVVY